jgi:cytochrome c-type biogenesis protein
VSSVARPGGSKRFRGAYGRRWRRPFLIAAFMVEQFSSLFSRMKRHLATVEHAMGVLKVITGIGFLTGAVSNVGIWLLETFPGLQNFG